MKRPDVSKQELFATVPVAQALFAMAIPTVISQLINLIYNVVDTFFIGRTGNSYMIAATSLTLTIVLLNIALSNLFGVGAGSLVARLMGRGEPEQAKCAGAFGFYGAFAAALLYSSVIGLFLEPILRFLGASDATIGYARSYALIVVVFGSLPSVLSLTLAHLLRNAGYSGRASMGLSVGGILNAALDPLFMFVLMPKGREVTGAALATMLSNTIACLYLLLAYRRACGEAPLSMDLRAALKLKPKNIRALFGVGIPSAILTGLFDLANVCVNILAAAHNDFVLAAMGIVMKVERVPNAINIGICQGMLPIVAFNYSSGNHVRMRDVIRAGRRAGLLVAFASIALLETFASPFSRLFINTSADHAETALITLGFCTLFLRIRCLASPVQFINYHTSYCMQAMGNGVATMLHACVRELVFYIPFMFLLDRLFGAVGLAAAMPVGEAFGAAFALWLLHRSLKPHKADLLPQ